MDKEYPEIKDLKEYADEIKLQIDNILCGNGYVTSDLKAKRDKANSKLPTIATKLAEHAKNIVAPKEKRTESDTVDAMELRKLANGMKLANVLKVHDRSGVYWIYKVDYKGNPRKPGKSKK